MTLLAGAVARRPNRRPLPEPLARSLLTHLSRHPGERLTVHRSAGAVLAKADIGAIGAPAFVSDPAGRISMLAGEPLLAAGAGTAGRTRDADLDRLHADWVEGRLDSLYRARGSFAAAHYRPEDGALWLVSDPLGIRPLYYWWDDDLIVFSSTLRLLEAIPELPRRMDIRAVAEITSQGFPLGRRTPYFGIERIGAAEAVRFEGPTVTVRVYRRWDSIPTVPRTEQELAGELDERFSAAVRRRLRDDRGVPAFLSGGMDSRTVVATLVREGARVRTFNFSPPEMQDHALASAFAREIGAAHQYQPMQAVMDEAKYATTLDEALAGPPPEGAPALDRPRLAWSGDGGSVGVGHVYLTAEVVAELRAGRYRTAVERFLAERQARVSGRILHRSVAESLVRAPAEGILAELRQIECDDPGRAFHLFLMLNDQRRHLTGHYEQIDRHRVELQLPFFDADLVQLVVESPLDACLYHRAYSRWLALLPPAATAVPWQTYPGHVPCPLPVPPSLEYQWDAGAFVRLREIRRRRLLRTTARMITRPSFPRGILNRGALAVAVAASALRLRECEYLLSAADLFDRYWVLSGGKHASS